VAGGTAGAHLAPCLPRRLSGESPAREPDRKQIEDSPAIESHKPLSRQYEEEYHRYYGWPYYWQGGEMWGMSGFPILELPQYLFRASRPLQLVRNPNVPMLICETRKP